MIADFAAQDPWVLPDPALVPVADGGRFLPIIGRLDHFSGQWQKLKTCAPERIEELRMVATIESVASSTRIEGATLTDEQVREVLAGVQIDSFSARDEQEVRGYRDLLELIREQYLTLSLTENSLKEFHRILMQYSEKDAWHRGEYKTNPNHVERAGGEGPPIVVFRTAGLAETQWWMQRLIFEFQQAWDSNEWHRLVLIADFILWLLAIHPFQDGNGRLARAVTTLVLLKAGYEYANFASLEKVIEERKIGYYVALRNSQAAAPRDVRNYDAWLDFFLSALEAQQQTLQARLARAIEREPLPIAQGLVLDLITERGALSTPAIAAALAIPARTVRYHLAQLTGKRLLDASPRRAGRLYSLPLSAEDTPQPFAAEAQTVVSGSASLHGREPPPLTPVEFSPALQQQIMASPNGRAYATVVVVGSDAARAPLGDHELDTFEEFARTVTPVATAIRATPDVAWWKIADEPRLDKFQMWLYPGPLVQIHWALDSSEASDDSYIALDPIGLVDFWRHVLGNASRLAAQLSFGECIVGLNLQTLPSGRPSIVDMDFSRLPKPVRSGLVQTVPPWMATRVPVGAEHLADDALLRPALDQLLRTYSYRHTDATVEAVFAVATAAWDPDSVPTRVVGGRGSPPPQSAS